MLSVSNPVLMLRLGCLRTCWIELSLQREHDFAILQELQFGTLFGDLLDPCPPSFRRQKDLGARLGASVASFDALWHLRGVTARPPVTVIPSWVPFDALARLGLGFLFRAV